MMVSRTITRIMMILFLASTVLMSVLITGCVDPMMYDSAAHTNYHYSYHTDYGYSNPRPVRNVHQSQSNRVYATQYNHYYGAPDAGYYNQPAPQRQRHQAYHRADPAPAPRHYDARQAQIASDRAMAQRLQNEEYVRAHREVEQIASDRALAERLQAEEYAR